MPHLHAPSHSLVKTPRSPLSRPSFGVRARTSIQTQSTTILSQLRLCFIERDIFATTTPRRNPQPSCPNTVLCSGERAAELTSRFNETFQGRFVGFSNGCAITRWSSRRLDVLRPTNSTKSASLAAQSLAESSKIKATSSTEFSSLYVISREMPRLS